MAQRQFSEEDREVLEAENETGYGESFPMPDCDAVRRAREEYGRAPTSKRPQLRAAIIRRHRELGCPDPLPEHWYR